MEHFPFLLFASPPLGPIAQEMLERYKYPPTAVISDTSLKVEDHLRLVEQHQPTFILVAGYGAILKQALLDSVAGQALNIHPSLLPFYRGAAPVVQAILDGATETGVSVMEMDKYMDHGPLLAQERYPLKGDERPSELYRVLTTRGIELLLENLNDYLTGDLELLPQDHSQASITHKISKEAGLLQPENESAVDMERKIRAFEGWPRAWFVYKDKRLLVDKAHLEVIDNSKLLRLDQVQPEGGKSMAWTAFCAGQRQKPEKIYQELALSA